MLLRSATQNSAKCPGGLVKIMGINGSCADAIEQAGVEIRQVGPASGGKVASPIEKQPEKSRQTG
jgi:hypothetical protein